MDCCNRQNATEFLFLLVKQMDRKIVATLQAILVFYIVSHPVVYRMTGFATAAGCPTPMGLIVHSIVFGAIVYGLMHL